jgi:choline kinase
LKIIILAAGQGTRLRPLTNDKPKCMVEYKNRSIIDYILDTVKECNIDEIAVVNGYKKEVLVEYLKDENITFFTNKQYDKTNMVSTLFCAKDFMDDDLIISYSDIIYTKGVLDKLIKSNYEFSVIVDKKWKELWVQRMSNPLDDAETLKIQKNKIIELGKKPKSYDEIDAQYIGLVKISKNVINKIIEFYEDLDSKAFYDGKNFDNMYMTSFIQMVIDNLIDVNPVYIDGGWIEVDCVDDLKTEMIEGNF